MTSNSLLLSIFFTLHSGFQNYRLFRIMYFASSFTLSRSLTTVFTYYVSTQSYIRIKHEMSFVRNTIVLVIACRHTDIQLYKILYEREKEKRKEREKEDATYAYVYRLPKRSVLNERPEGKITLRVRY